MMLSSRESRQAASTLCFLVQADYAQVGLLDGNAARLLLSPLALGPWALHSSSRLKTLRRDSSESMVLAVSYAVKLALYLPSRHHHFGTSNGMQQVAKPLACQVHGPY